MKRYLKPLLFALSLIPAALTGGIFVAVYQLDMLDPAIVEEAVAQAGSRQALIAISAGQSVLYAAVCAFFGYILAEKLGLMRPIGIERRPLCITLAASFAGGILFSLDPWVFGRFLPEIGISSMSLSLTRLAASVLYGGVVEEILLRLFMMSLIAFIIWKICFRRHGSVPAKAVITANIAAAVLFAAGHLPATYALFGDFSAVILLRCFLLNGGFGLLLGFIYRKYGIQYAMLSHALIHMTSQLIWYIFI